MVAPIALTDAVAPLVLVAEDNEDNRFIAATMLRHVGYRVIEAETGHDAIRLARSEQPSLILMDVGMPEIDGWTATRTLKDDDATKHIVILAFTAHALPSDAILARNAGCDGYLAKPVEPSRLVREVAAALGGGVNSGH
jgi:two-component system, cell cycle response regulator DivK